MKKLTSHLPLITAAFALVCGVLWCLILCGPLEPNSTFYYKTTFAVHLWRALMLVGLLGLAVLGRFGSKAAAPALPPRFGFFLIPAAAAVLWEGLTVLTGSPDLWGSIHGVLSLPAAAVLLVLGFLLLSERALPRILHLLVLLPVLWALFRLVDEFLAFIQTAYTDARSLPLFASTALMLFVLYAFAQLCGALPESAKNLRSVAAMGALLCLSLALGELGSMFLAEGPILLSMPRLLVYFFFGAAMLCSLLTPAAPQKKEVEEE